MSTNTTAKIAALVSVVIVLHVISALFPLDYGSFGTIDFIQYWRSWGILVGDKNPYDHALVSAQHFMNVDSSTPLVVSWNPPWTFVLLAPFLSEAFGPSARLWMLIQFLLLGVIAMVTPAALSDRRMGLLLRAATVMIFFPTLNSLYFGQLGILLAASVALFLFCQQRGALFAAGLFLVPLSVKPHLFLLLVPPGLKWLAGLPRPQAYRFLGGACGGLALLIGCTTVISPSSIPNWLSAIQFDSRQPSVAGAVPLAFWQTANISTWLRILCASDHVPEWPLRVVPLVALALTTGWFIMSKKPIVWRDIAPPLLCLALITSNYGWVYDQSVLVVLQMAIICGALELPSRTLRLATIALAFAAQILAIYLSDSPQHHFVWLPLFMLSMLLFVRAMTPAERLQ
jgi:hypothetical protein